MLHGHHHTCKLADKYCDDKKKVCQTTSNKVRMQYEGRESDLWDLNTVALFNPVKKNSLLEPLQDRPPPTHKFFLLESNQNISMIYYN